MGYDVGQWAGAQNFSSNPGIDTAVARSLTGVASVIAGAATRSLITGTDFGDNIIKGLPDVIGQTVGNGIADQIGQDPAIAQQQALAQQETQAYENSAIPYTAAPIEVTSQVPSVSYDEDGIGSVNVTPEVTLGDTSSVGNTLPQGPETVTITHARMTPEEQLDFDIHYKGWWDNFSMKELAPVANTGLLRWVLPTSGQIIQGTLDGIGTGLAGPGYGLKNLVENPVGTAKGLAFYLSSPTLASMFIGAKEGTEIGQGLKLAQQNGTVPRYISSLGGQGAVFGATLLSGSGEVDVANLALDTARAPNLLADSADMAATGAFNPIATASGDGLGIFADRSAMVTQKGLDLVTDHLSQSDFLTEFGAMYPQNAMMLERLQAAAAAGEPVTGADAIFYTHEASEATMMADGMSYDEAHSAALEKYGVSPFSVYHPDVIEALPESFNSNWRNFWGIGP